jgi:hypothetical protein
MIGQKIQNDCMGKVFSKGGRNPADINKKSGAFFGNRRNFGGCLGNRRNFGGCRQLF